MTATEYVTAPEAPPLSRVTLADIPEALARIAALEQDAHADREKASANDLDHDNRLGRHDQEISRVADRVRALEGVRESHHVRIRSLAEFCDKVGAEARSHGATLDAHADRLLVLERRLPDLTALADLRARAEKIEATAETLVRLAEAAAADAARAADLAAEIARERQEAVGKVGPRKAWYKRILGLQERR